MPVTHVTSLSDRTLGELVAEEGARARVLEQYGIDYCCHGDRTLRAACDETDLDTEQIAAELQAVQPAPATVVDGGPLALLEHIVATHHTYLDAELPAVESLAAKVRDVHGEHHPELAQVAELVAALHAELEPHLRREEQVVFPAIARLVLGGIGVDVGADIAELMSEHEHAGEVLRELRSATGSYAVPADGCASYRSLYERLEAIEKDTFRHIHLENNVLFPAVQALLS